MQHTAQLAHAVHRAGCCHNVHAYMQDIHLLKVECMCSACGRVQLQSSSCCERAFDKYVDSVEAVAVLLALLLAHAPPC
jgi:hypothetical protein